MRFARSLLLTAALLALLPAAVRADTFTVNKRGDHVPGSCTADDCTLREAVAAAANQPAGAPHKIKLPSTKPYRLTRSAANPGPDEAKGDLDLNIAGNWYVAIVHPGPGRAKIDASAADDRVLELNGSSTLRKIMIRGGTVTGGNSGGGIHASGDFNGLTLERSKVVGNQTGQSGGGIYATIGHLRIEDSVIAGNIAGGGGGVFATADVNLQMHRSTVTGNLADHDGDGGGLWVGTGPGEGASLITDSTFAGNETTAGGGGIASDAWALNIRNSTLTKNRAAGRGGALFGGADTSNRLNGVTIARNRADTDNSGGADTGGGIFADGGEEVVTIQNSLLANNRSTADAINECDGPSPPNIGSLGGNLITSTNDCPFFDHPQDILNTEPLIAKLKDAGGPTKTIPLKAGSPAINQADGPDPLESDQRGQLRVNPDIGAFER